VNPIREHIPTVSFLPWSSDTDDVDEGGTPEWERSSRFKTAKRYLTLYPFLTASVVLLIVTLVFYFRPILPTAHRRASLPFIAGLLVSHGLVGVWRERAGVRRLQNYSLHVGFRGNTVHVRLGQQADLNDDRLIGFKPLAEFAHGGLRTRFESFRDRFSRREVGDHKEKYHRAGSDGEGKVVDAFYASQTADTSAFRNDIELFNSVIVSHVGEQQPDLDSKNVDSVSTLPPRIDARTSSDIRTAFTSEREARREEERIRGMLEDHVDELAEYIDPAGQPLFENTIGLIQTMTDIQTDAAVDGRQRRQQQIDGEIDRRMRDGDEQ